MNLKKELMILLFRPSSSSDTFITASSNHLSELMWRALTSWTRLRFVDFFMRDTSSLFKWFNVKVHSWEVGGNKLETLMNILFTPAESSSLLCFFTGSSSMVDYLCWKFEWQFYSPTSQRYLKPWTGRLFLQLLVSTSVLLHKNVCKL